MLVRPGDVVEVREGSRKRTYFQDLPAVAEAQTVPAWLDRDVSSLSARVVQEPDRRDIDATLDEQLIIEYYSR
jgi:small subunit ribosomal protein S4